MNIAKVAKAVALAGAAFGIGATVASCKKEEGPLPLPPVPIHIVDPPLLPPITDTALIHSLETVQNVLNTLPTVYQGQMAEIVRTAAMLPENKQKEFWTWFDENKPVNFGSDANATETFLATCREKLHELAGG